jgi:hypothetical protein
VASQFIINLGLQATPRPDGAFDAKFVYVSTSPVPPGSWYWLHIDGHRLALKSSDSTATRHRFYPRLYDGPHAPARYVPPLRDTSRMAPVRVPSRPPGHR